MLRMYVSAVVTTGVFVLVTNWPRTLPPRWVYAGLFLLTLACSGVRLRVPLRRGLASIAPSDAFPLTTVLLYGGPAAMPMAAAGAIVQSTGFGLQLRPLHRHVFNAAALVLTIHAVALAHGWLQQALEPWPATRVWLAVLGSATVYFLVNSMLVGGAVALSTRQPPWTCWRENFLWMAPGYYLSAGLAAITAFLVAQNLALPALLVLAPYLLCYGAYRTYFQQLKREQARLLVTLRTLDEAVVTTDVHGTIVLFNGAAETLLGLSAAHAEGHALTAVLHLFERQARHRRVDPLDRLASGSPSLWPALTLRSATGAERQVELRGSPLADGDGRRFGFVLVIRDVTAQKQAEQERLNAGRLESLSLLAGGIARDLTTVLGAFTDALEQMSAETGAARHGALQDAERATVRGRTLTQQLQALARHASSDLRPMDITSILRECARFAGRSTDTTIDVVIAPDLWPVEADASQLERVVVNILMNAAHAGRQADGRRLRASNLHADQAAPASIPRGDYVLLDISELDPVESDDAGTIVGLPPTTALAAGGSLGLAASHAIVAAHGGYVALSAEAGRGSTVRVFLPRYTGSAAPAAPSTRGVEPPPERLAERESRPTVRRHDPREPARR